MTEPRIEIIPSKDAEARPFDRRTAIHSHIRGLGLQDSDADSACGFVGQHAARSALGCILSIARERKMAGRAVLLVGPSGTGKTALALGLAQELGARVPFTAITGSEVYSTEVKKTEVLMEHFRRSIGLLVRETKQVYEGEVTIITPVEVDNPFGSISGSRAISHLLVTLKASKGTKQLKLDPSLLEAFQRERISVGDVIYIESATGSVKRLGRSEAFASEFDLEADEYVPLPKDQVLKKKELLQQVTLHDLDVANAQPAATGAIATMVMPWKKTEITERLRSEVNKTVNEYIEAGTAELIPGVLFIDEAHMLDLECFSFLNRALESPIAPVVVLATNRGMAEIRGSKDFNNNGIISAHGMPSDLLDRLVIVPTSPYSEAEISKIIAMRSKIEGVELNEEALALLGSIGISTSLRYPLMVTFRYALHLLSPSKINAEIESANQGGQPIVTKKHVLEAQSLFVDPGRSIASRTDL